MFSCLFQISIDKCLFLSWTTSHLWASLCPVVFASSKVFLSTSMALLCTFLSSLAVIRSCFSPAIPSSFLLVMVDHTESCINCICQDDMICMKYCSQVSHGRFPRRKKRFHTERQRRICNPEKGSPTSSSSTYYQVLWELDQLLLTFPSLSLLLGSASVF